METIRNNWTEPEICQVYDQPLLDLVYQAATVHRRHHNPQEVQRCTLLSIKTGGCSEDCSYCPQAARYQTAVKSEPLLSKDKVLAAAQKAKFGGSSRFCMGAAWRSIKNNEDFEKVLEMVHAVNELGLEVCCTLGMLTDSQAQRLADAGLFAYNHNIDTSREYYDSVISTREYDDRLKTLGHVRKAGISVCSGGIVGLGESKKDRVAMLWTLATLEKHPESVPINALVPVKGTPLESQEKIPFWDVLRSIATARIIMPLSTIRLSAGRSEMSQAQQAFCFMAGANSIFTGEKLLTTPNPDFDEDQSLFETLGLQARKAFQSREPQKNDEVLVSS